MRSDQQRQSRHLLEELEAVPSIDDDYNLCPECEAYNLVTANFCSQCGEPLKRPEDIIASAPKAKRDALKFPVGAVIGFSSAIIISVAIWFGLRSGALAGLLVVGLGFVLVISLILVELQKDGIEP